MNNTTINTQLVDPPSIGFIRLSQLLEFIHIPEAEPLRWIKGGIFPMPLQFKDGVLAWESEKLQKFLREENDKGVLCQN